MLSLARNEAMVPIGGISADIDTTVFTGAVLEKSLS